MPITDLAHGAARRYVDALPINVWVIAVLERLGDGLGVRPAMRRPAHLGDLVAGWRRVYETALVEHLTIPELAALARFYATSEGASALRKMQAFNAALTPALTAELVTWAQTVAAQVGQQSSSDEVTA